MRVHKHKLTVLIAHLSKEKSWRGMIAFIPNLTVSRGWIYICDYLNSNNELRLDTVPATWFQRDDGDIIFGANTKTKKFKKLLNDLNEMFADSELEVYTESDDNKLLMSDLEEAWAENDELPF